MKINTLIKTAYLYYIKVKTLNLMCKSIVHKRVVWYNVV